MKLPASLALASAVAVASFAAGAYGQAQKGKEEYVPSADIKTLVKKPLAGLAGKQITIFRVTAAPDWVGGKHYHTGPVFVYVLKGPFNVEEEAKGAQSFDTGAVYEEPIGHAMQARNPDSSGPMELLVIQVSNEGEPLMYKAD
jgi:quercetin dioxygenase-like cupin family protein